MDIKKFGPISDPVGERLQKLGEDGKPKNTGKPLPKGYLEMDVLQNFQKIAKENGYLPTWLELQKEIYELVVTCENEDDVAAINILVRKYNKACPPMMQKNLVSLELLEKAKEVWK